MSTTTMFIRDTARKTASWSPVLLRGSLWVGIASVTELLKAFARWHSQQTITGLDIWQAVGEMILAGMIACRLFLDQTLSRHVEEQKKLSETEFFRQQAAAGQTPPKP
jgi:hypothetical protein